MVKDHFGNVTVPGGRSIPPGLLARDLRIKFNDFVRAVWLQKNDIGLSFRSEMIERVISFHEKKLRISGDLLVPAACIIAAIARGQEIDPLNSAVEAIERYLRRAGSEEKDRAGKFVDLLREYADNARYRSTARLIEFAGAALVYDGTEPGER